MAEFHLDEAAVAQVEQLLQSTGEQVEAEADRAADLIVTIVGSSWRGAAGNAAAAKVHNEFVPAKTKLVNEINRLSEALGQGRQAVMAQDDEGMQSIQMVDPGGGNFGRL